ncbi:MAG: 5-formyltetrahydrofolate cyclo-ligase [Ruminococcaceae bacterium]|nr:5-formyltetrahydrofolate cyclo-ligase [Oscillospiraceae bacterium]
MPPRSCAAQLLPTDAMTDKKALRAELLAKRKAISSEEKARLDAALVKHIAEHPAFLSANALLCYLPIRGEPDLTPLLALAESRDIPVYLPRCDKNGMRFLLYTEQACLTPDRFGILAPGNDAQEVAPTARTLCLVPGLAAARDGTRLGYGGGFYDRFLPHFEGKTLFALYEQFVFDTLPHGAYDFLIDPKSIMTEKGAL